MATPDQPQTVDTAAQLRFSFLYIFIFLLLAFSGTYILQRRRQFRGGNQLIRDESRQLPQGQLQASPQIRPVFWEPWVEKGSDKWSSMAVSQVEGVHGDAHLCYFAFL